mgnify:CR=1 FL=1
MFDPGPDNLFENGFRYDIVVIILFRSKITFWSILERTRDLHACTRRTVVYYNVHNVWL